MTDSFDTGFFIAAGVFLLFAGAFMAVTAVLNLVNYRIEGSIRGVLVGAGLVTTGLIIRRMQNAKKPD